MPTMREIADVIRKINGIETEKVPPAKVIVRRTVINNDKIFNKLVAKKVRIYDLYGDLECPDADFDDFDPWSDLGLELPND